MREAIKTSISLDTESWRQLQFIIKVYGDSRSGVFKHLIQEKYTEITKGVINDAKKENEY